MLRKLSKFYYTEFRFKLLFAITLLVAGALAEGVGLAAILTLFDENKDIKFLSFIENDLNERYTFSILFFLFLFRGVLLWLVNMYSAFLVIQLKEKIYNALMQSSFNASYTSIINIGEIPISNLLVREILNISAGFKVYMQMIKSVFISSIYFILPVIIIPEVVKILFLFSLVLLIIVLPVQVIMRRLSAKLVTANERYLKRLKSAFAAIASIKAGNRSQKVNADIESKITALLQIERTQTVKIEPLVANIIESFVFFTILILIVLNERFGFVSDSIFILCVGMIFKSLTTIVGAYGNLRKIATYSGSFEKFTDVKTYLDENLEVLSNEWVIPEFQLDKISLVNISIKVTDEFMLSQISMKIEKSEMIALVGSSGTGKSTLLNCIATLIEPDSGEYIINGIYSAKELRSELRSSISLITQNYYFEEDTVEECFDFQRNKPLEVLTDLLELDLIRDESEYEAFLGRSLSSLSGGERQRLSLAKEMCTENVLFLLDEVTSALSKLHEQVVLTYLKRKLGGRMAVLVTHSSFVAQSVDHIINVENFRING